MNDKLLAEIQYLVAEYHGNPNPNPKPLPWAMFCDGLLAHVDAQAERLRVLEALEAELATLAKLRAEVGAETATAILVKVQRTQAAAENCRDTESDDLEQARWQGEIDALKLVIRICRANGATL